MTRPKLSRTASKLAAFVAKDLDVAKGEFIEAMRKANPDVTQKEIDLEVGLVEATIGF